MCVYIYIIFVITLLKFNKSQLMYQTFNFVAIITLPLGFGVKLDVQWIK
jgi:hypothetical protein